MKKGIHPKFVEAQVVCACGTSFKTRSTKPLLKVEVCSHCHPFFTGQQRMLDTGGQVERFMRRLGAAAKPAERVTSAPAPRAERAAPEHAESPPPPEGESESESAES
ncbi:MAG: 50S ribosomal protein L31 [Chloroflexi bacterium]|nr:50S ribosomal protein L31 [Chloroflexota bacterium]